ncbi:MAG: hypothetical protein GX200_05370 [Firmicutes bacterium]|nr:hypothetical protein [Bacillota bacterium]
MYNDAKLEALPVSKVKFVGREGLPVWAITYFLEKTCLYHMKLTILQRICDLAANGVPDDCFYAVASSADIFPEEAFANTKFKDVIVYSEKSRDTNKFWHIIGKYKRPIVLLKNKDNKFIPLCDFQSDEAAKIWSFKEQSPPEGIIKGAAGALIDLFFAHERENRLRLEHMQKQIGLATKNLQSIVSASKVILSDDTPAGVRRYAEAQLNAILEAQAKLNREIGIIDNIEFDV